LAVFSGLTDVSNGNKSSVRVNHLSLTDSAFCELEADSVASRNVSHLDRFGLIYAFDDGINRHRYWMENLPKRGPCYDDISPSSKSFDSQLLAESSDMESSKVEAMETSGMASLCRNAEWNDSSRVLELSSCCSLSDESAMSSDPDMPCMNEQVIDDNQLSNGSCHAKVHVALPSDTSSVTTGNESQLAQHQPLVFFIIGLFVGLSLGFLTCKYRIATVQIPFFGSEMC